MPELFASHSEGGMIDVRREWCCHEGCSQVPSYGIAGKKELEFCAQHTKDGMMNIGSKRCSNEGCSTRAS